MSLLIKGPPKFVPSVYPCWAILEAVNVAVAKPAIVRRTWGGANYVFDCYVMQHVRDEWLVGNIAVGDYVLVDYSDQDPDREQVIARIVETW